jgi:hypothetical protein
MSVFRQPPYLQPAAPNVLPSGTAPQIIGAPVGDLRAALWRGQYWSTRDYWTAPQNILPQSVVQISVPSPPLEAAHRRDLNWDQSRYWVKSPTVPIPGVAVRIIMPAGLQDAAYRRDQYWSLSQYAPKVYVRTAAGLPNLSSAPDVLVPGFNLISLKAH